MSTTRTEIDLLGSMEVPSDAYYGVHTLRAIDNYKISGKTINDVPEFIKGMVMVKKATAIANQRVHTIPGDVAEAIIKACDEILENGRCMDQFPIDVFQGGAGTSVNMNTNEVVANLALEIMGFEKGRYDVINPNDDVNQCQSTNDAYPTGFRMAVHMALIELQKHFDALVEALHAKGDEFNDIITMGRTQLQDAVPMTLGQAFHAFANNLEEEQESLTRASDRLLEINLGATAIGTGVNAPSGYREAVTQALREVSGFNVTSAKDLIEATSDTGAYVSVHASLKRTAMKLSKMCNDLRLLASGPRAGLNEINLPERAAGSSIMPAKVNPVIPEVVNQACFKVFGNDVTLTWAAEAGQLQLNVMEPVIGECIFETISLLQHATDTLKDKCIVDITANPEVCRGYVENSIGIVTYLNPVIGHHEGDVVGKEAARTGRSIREIILERGLMEEDELDKLLSTENLMHPEYRGKRYIAGETRLDEIGEPK
ncbi:aspartate ammonia-lyase [Corynebacterium lactis]|uniref:Aspartate ammonia-lyase n=1 Tax=Corynebacterium lactis RW2-5 TaxID=1408189 RepID=A0A0K2H063_9CORY|nr:aspartate ammonia-lyase [Corynebacterium lactis]ALA67432.1 aspartate ammonia-lyase [Corynebacterium lactis RW2-5]